MIAQILDRLFQPLRYFASIKRGVIKAGMPHEILDCVGILYVGRRLVA